MKIFWRPTSWRHDPLFMTSKSPGNGAWRHEVVSNKIFDSWQPSQWWSMNFKWSCARAWNLVYDSLYFTCNNSLSSGQYVRHESFFWFTQEQCGYHGNQWPKPIFASPLHVPTKFGGRRSINSREEGCENFPCFLGEICPESMIFRFLWQPLEYFSMWVFFLLPLAQDLPSRENPVEIEPKMKKK